MFAYCNNNPVVHKDSQGTAVETVWDLISLGASIVEVAVNPSDPWAWAGLVGDIADVCIPFVGGIGEAVDAVKLASGVVKNTDNVVDAAKALKPLVSKATGSYEIIYKSGKNYVGKGSYTRALSSAERYVKKYGDEVTSISWKSAPTNKTAFVDEYHRMQKRGVNNANTYNKIWSPGRKHYSRELHGLFS